MSEHIDNRGKQASNRQERQKILKEIILQLHDGKDPGEVQQQFASLIDGVAASEISEMEAGLIADGMPIEEVQRLCDLHADIFKGSVEEVHTASREEERPGHPVRVLKEENFAVTNLIKGSILPMIHKLGTQPTVKERYGLLEHINLLMDLDKHYSRKENIFFPYMEKYGITAPPKVMWGVDDEIRAMIKAFKVLLQSDETTGESLKKAAEEMTTKILDMIVKEESIMVPMLLDVLTEDEWLAIAEDSEEIGYCIVSPEDRWMPARQTGNETLTEAAHDGMIRLETGFFSVDELTRMLNTLPFDMTFIDQDDVVKYFSQSAERIFPRTKSVIGRTVQNCHPPASVHVVEAILDAFKSGRKDHEDFWITMGDAFIYIRYFAVRNDAGEYLGTLEVTQNIKPIQAITGEKRLLSEEF
ncbi:DUF438 domain-containing protein [Anoxynatronum buryatiense]|uniref:DUF438 domain-containing protein n=1 Tax=Anoxynatronum buryatiense TaxID=489973 RepID=A0AA45WXZ1_9CLOT|nr:DUF438 domain-containing protein [Anoxynatronum buryatiense]SMP66394.1 hypothetical protein SAMN06296020_11423 [Anoxynatronum buryatiense]